jgi:trans-aconitate methyltransferase
MSDQLFDDIAGRYDEVLNEGLAASGETREYFAYHRLRQLRRLLEKYRLPLPGSILDYGCGTGGATSSLREIFPSARLVGTDISLASLEVARKKYGELGAVFLTQEEISSEQFDLIFCNGVFHHIQPLDRLPVLEFIRDHLAPAGLFGFFENNPWNPGTMHIMRKCPFDKDAVVIPPSKAIRLLESQGFQWIVLHTLFYFPRSLAFLRPLENFLGRFPLGGQYLVLCRSSS